MHRPHWCQFNSNLALYISQSVKRPPKRSTYYNRVLTRLKRLMSDSFPFSPDQQFCANRPQSDSLRPILAHDIWVISVNLTRYLSGLELYSETEIGKNCERTVLNVYNVIFLIVHMFVSPFYKVRLRAFVQGMVGNHWLQHTLVAFFNYYSRFSNLLNTM